MKSNLCNSFSSRVMRTLSGLRWYRRLYIRFNSRIIWDWNWEPQCSKLKLICSEYCMRYETIPRFIENFISFSGNNLTYFTSQYIANVDMLRIPTIVLHHHTVPTQKDHSFPLIHNKINSWKVFLLCFFYRNGNSHQNIIKITSPHHKLFTSQKSSHRCLNL